LEEEPQLKGASEKENGKMGGKFQAEKKKKEKKLKKAKNQKSKIENRKSKMTKFFYCGKKAFLSAREAGGDGGTPLALKKFINDGAFCSPMAVGRRRKK